MNAVSPSDFERDRLIARIVTSLPALTTGSLRVVSKEVAHYIDLETVPLDLPPGSTVDGLNRLLERIDLDERGRRAGGIFAAPPPSPGPWMIAKLRDQDFDFIVPAEEPDEEGGDRASSEAAGWTTQAELAAVFRDYPSAVSIFDLLRAAEPGEVFQIHPAARWGRK